MHENKSKTDSKSIIIMFVAALFFAVFLGLLCRPLIPKAADHEDATLTDANERLQEFRDAAQVATSGDATPTDVDRSPYLTNDVSLLQTNDLLLSIRNILVCIWFTIFLLWGYDRMKAVIFRLGGFRNDK